MRIGFHLPVSKGFEWTFKESQRLHCDAVQIFVRNPRSWAAKQWRDEDLVSFGRLFKEMPVFAHLSYLPNLARIDEEPRNLIGFMDEVDLCRQIGIKAMVVHCGSRDDRARGVESVADAINRVTALCDLHILLENSAGQGSSMGSDLSDLFTIFEKVEDSAKVSLCLDTSHLFEAGYDVRRRKVWNDIVSGIERNMGKDKIGLLHLNDSKTSLGSKVDRHWHMGRGEIGTQAFKFILNDKRFAGLCGVMETPKTGGMDEINMKVMRSLLSPLVSRSLS
jgi:deoxyribonuclease-4